MDLQCYVKGFFYVALLIVDIHPPIGARWRRSAATATSGVLVIAEALLITPVVWIAEAAIGRTERRRRARKKNMPIFRHAPVERWNFPRAEESLEPQPPSTCRKSFCCQNIDLAT